MNTITTYLYYLLLFCGVFFSSHIFAQTFMIQNGSELYDAKIEIKHCTKEECSGYARITLYQKNTQRVVEQFESEDLNFYLNQKQKPSVNVVQLYGEYSPLIFDDFNFDGTEDLAFRDGNNGPYGGPTYQVYVYHKAKREFLYSEDLSALTQENLGMFEIDPVEKRIITRAKSGCCYHEMAQYQVSPSKGLVLVEELIEDARSGGTDQQHVKVTTRKLIQGNWREWERYYPLDQYYR